MSTSLAHLTLSLTEDVTVETSAVLCTLSRLQCLGLRVDLESAFDTPEAAIILELPLLEELVIAEFGSTSIELQCPKLQELELDNVELGGFSGMPSSVQKVVLQIDEESVPLKEIMPANSADSLEVLVLGMGFKRAELATVQQICLNGRLKRLSSPSYRAFAVSASWQAVPQTLEDVTLDLSLGKGIPIILEQLFNLTTLIIKHKRSGSHPHLDRPLDPFLAMPRLRKLELGCDWDRDALSRGTQCRWTPTALRFIGLAEKRILQMRMTPPGRSITFTY